MSVLIIAEAGVNHNGDFNLAKKLIDMAKECGADAIKFQTFKAYESTGVFAEKAQYQKENVEIQESQLEMIEKLELPFEDFKRLKEYCNEKGIIFVSTPDGLESLDFLISLCIPFIKIGSTEVSNIEFLKAIGKTGKEVVLSTGMSTLGEVEKAIDVINSTGNQNIKIMHCTTDYPTAVEDVNLKAMVTMREAFKVPVGLSDHTMGNEAAIAAVALGAEFIEKHITLDRNMEGPDHKASMPKKEFKAYVKAIRDTEILLGDGIKKPTKREKMIMQNVRRSIVAAMDIEEGTILSRELLSYKRPGYGIDPEMGEYVIGRKIKRSVVKDELILWQDI
ncbi:N-acetylneuraminate synthase [Clostridium cavendishii DSM 21758]|uniref:N-acetylneuraminate synthase n=1 Tax=Clostridium cavendishii DSM 21758 TaxID=1121302 RepID=A0A1M6QAX8_9CLOT|nr:N-acetylneuraminate synthase [Clostridium cavendishii]SHK17318.1 N-acetylneuraminate synthase [Clostridium cavendishii DSM 21758]